MKNKLTPRQERFADEYLIDFDATAAYKRAGYKCAGNAANVGACKLLARAPVQARIKERRERISAKLEIDAERIMAELAAMAFFVLPSAPIGEILPVEQWPEDARKMIAGIEIDGARDGASRACKIRLASKLDALVKLGQQHGLFGRQVKHSGTLTHKNDPISDLLDEIDGADVGVDQREAGSSTSAGRSNRFAAVNRHPGVFGPRKKAIRRAGLAVTLTVTAEWQIAKHHVDQYVRTEM